MSFLFGLLDGALKFLPLVNEVGQLLAQLSEAQEKATKELKEKLGQEIEVSLALLRTKEGPKFAVVIDLPGDVEQPLAQLLQAYGLRFKVYQAN